MVLAIRGSEAQDEQMALDWLVADANFANSDLTLQEKTLNKYIDEELTDLIKEKGYSNLAISGHSLAGYLGFEAAAHLAVSNPFLFDIFMQATSLDGPGVTEENYEANKYAYDLIKDKCTHYHYTTVGSLLKSICDEDHYISLKGASDWQKYAIASNLVPNRFINGATISQFDGLLQYISGNFIKHTLPSLQFNDDGSFDLDAVAPPDYPQQFIMSGGTANQTIGAVNVIMQIAMYKMNCWLVETDNLEEDAFAQIIGKATRTGDRHNLVQIAAGAFVETAIEEYFFIVRQSNTIDDFIKLKEDVITAINQKIDNKKTVLACFEELMTDLADTVSSVGNNTVGTNTWFKLLSDIESLSEAGCKDLINYGVDVPDFTDVGNDLRIIGGIAVAYYE